jgi:hypothetical protein
MTFASRGTLGRRVEDELPGPQSARHRIAMAAKPRKTPEMTSRAFPVAVRWRQYHRIAP